MKVLGFHFQDDTLTCSDGSTCHDNYLDFLLKDDPPSLNIFYNIDWAVANLCRHLKIPEEQLLKFWKSNNLYLDSKHQIFFVPHRYLSIQIGKEQAIFSDAFQYNVDLPFEVDVQDAAKQAQEIGQRVYDVLTRLNLKPASLSSPIAAYQKEILSTLDLEKPEHTPAEVQLYAHYCLHGGWQETWQRGHFEQGYDYDLVSAFSYHTRDLLDTRYGTWFKSDKFYPQLPYGFCKGTVAVDKDFNPVIYTAGEFDYTPTGQRECYMTNKAIKQLYDRGIGRFKLESGWYWKPDKLVYPLKEHTERLFEWKQYLEGFDRDIVKRILVGLTGKLGETFPDKNGEVKPGKLHNLPWYSWVQDQTKLQVADFIILNHAEDALLSIAVDGCLFNRKIFINETGAIGTWRLNLNTPAFVVSSGVGCIQGKNGKGTFALNYDWLKAQIEANPEATEYKMHKLTPVTIGNALKNHKVDKLGELEMTERAVILNEVKRYYPEYPKKGSDLLNQYSSEALDISQIEAESYLSKEII
jgi:hypothetical protein